MSIEIRSEDSNPPWKTSFFQKATAARKPKLVIAYNIIGIQGLRRLAIRRPRGREYADEIADRLDEGNGDDVERLKPAERGGEGWGRELEGMLEG